MLYEDVKNTSVLLNNTRLLAVCSVINPRLICGKLQLAAAMQRLVNSMNSSNHFRSRNALSELMLMLSPTKNIAEAIRLFSCEGTEEAVLFALYKPSREDIGFLTGLVEGSSIPLTSLAQLCDIDGIVKTYHLAQSEMLHCGLESCAVNRIATSDI